MCSRDPKTGWWIDSLTSEPIDPDRLITLDDKCIDINTLHKYVYENKRFVSPFTELKLPEKLIGRIQEYNDELATMHKMEDRRRARKERKLGDEIQRKERRLSREIEKDREDRIDHAVHGQMRLIDLEPDERKIATRRMMGDAHLRKEKEDIEYEQRLLNQRKAKLKLEEARLALENY